MYTVHSEQKKTPLHQSKTHSPSSWGVQKVTDKHCYRLMRSLTPPVQELASPRSPYWRLGYRQPTQQNNTSKSRWSAECWWMSSKTAAADAEKKVTNTQQAGTLLGLKWKYVTATYSMSALYYCDQNTAVGIISTANYNGQWKIINQWRK